MKIKAKISSYYSRFLKLQGTPHTIAKGCAIGTFFGIAPVMPFRSLFIITASVVTKSNPIAAFLVGTVFSNPLTYVPVYYLDIIVGNRLTPYCLNVEKIRDFVDKCLNNPNLIENTRFFFSLGLEAIIVMMVGGVVIATPMSIIVYLIAFHYFTRLNSEIG